MSNGSLEKDAPPAAWVWSQYRAFLPAESASGAASHAAATTVATAHEGVAPPEETIIAMALSEPVAPKGAGFVGPAVAALILAIVGLTWLFSSQPALQPAAETPREVALPASAPESVTPPAVAPAPVAAPAEATAPAAAPPQNAAAPAPKAQGKKHKKTK